MTRSVSIGQSHNKDTSAANNWERPKMSHVTRKPIFGVCDQGRLKSACAATKARQRLEISDIETKGIILSRQWTTKALIRLRRCAGWSAPLLFAYGITGFLMTRLRWDGDLKEWVFDYFLVFRVNSHCLFYADSGHKKDTFFLWLYKLTPIWFEDNSLDDIFDFQKQKMWNVTVDAMSRDMIKPAKCVCAQRRFRSGWASAQSDQSLRCALNR